MSDAILSLGLWRRHFIVAAKLQLAFHNVIERIGSPGQRILRATSWPTASTPFVRKNDLGPVVIEGCRVPVGKSGIYDLIQSLRISGIGDIQQNAIP